MPRFFLRIAIALAVLFLSGCAANQLPGYQNTYKGYTVPDAQMDKISRALRESGLPNARVMRDLTGRVRLAGSYKDEEEVDSAFIIVQSIVGIKLTSPFYPEQVEVTRWQAEAARILAERARAVKLANAAKSQKRALVIGINQFKDRSHLSDIPGEDDAKVVAAAAKKAGYTVTAVLGKDATKAAIISALEQMERDVGPDDNLFIYISSHGFYPIPTPEGGDNRKMSIIAYDTGNPAVKTTLEYNLSVHRTSVPDTLVQRLASKTTRNTRILIDTCYSGDMLQGIPNENAEFIRQTNGGKTETAGISMASWTGPQFTSKGIRLKDDNARPLVKGQDRDWSDRSQPYTIFTATGEDQQSWAPPPQPGTFPSPTTGQPLTGSFFTQAFFAYLEKYNGQMEPAFEEARAFTAKTVRDIGHEQVPRIYSTMPLKQNNIYQ